MIRGEQHEMLLPKPFKILLEHEKLLASKLQNIATCIFDLATF